MLLGKDPDAVSSTAAPAQVRLAVAGKGSTELACSVSDDEGSESLATAEILIDHFEFSHAQSVGIGRGVLM